MILKAYLPSGYWPVMIARSATQWRPAAQSMVARHKSSCARSQLSRFWIPSALASNAQQDEGILPFIVFIDQAWLSSYPAIGSHDKLCRAGFLRQVLLASDDLRPLC
jgi:hypothetical protein